jgi:hypothetical protein
MLKEMMIKGGAVVTAMLVAGVIIDKLEMKSLKRNRKSVVLKSEEEVLKEREEIDKNWEEIIKNN